MRIAEQNAHLPDYLTDWQRSGTLLRCRCVTRLSAATPSVELWPILLEAARARSLLSPARCQRNPILRLCRLITGERPVRGRVRVDRASKAVGSRTPCVESPA